jgi:DNA-binding transcriptional ArsR family regulator
LVVFNLRIIIYEYVNILESAQLTEQDFINLSEVFSALSSSMRLKIVWLLASQSYSVSQLVHLTNGRQASVSQHLAILRAKKIVIYERRGKENFYSLNMKCVFFSLGCILEHLKGDM